MFFLTELGKKLKETREEKGITLDNLQDVTKIQKRYLLAIEQGRYEVIPGKFYVRAFIKQYAEAVGLNPEVLFDEYRNDIPSVYEDDLPEQLSRSQSRRMVSKGPNKFLEILPKIIMAILIIGIIIAIWVVIQNYFGNEKASGDGDKNPSIGYEDNIPDNRDGDEGNQNGDGPSGDEEPVDENPVDDEPVVEAELVFLETTGREDSLYELINADEFQLKVSVIEGGASWINIVDGSGKELFRGTLNQNQPATETFDLSDQESVWIRVGNAGATEIFVNDLKLQYEMDPEKNVVQNITIRFSKTEEE